LIIRFILAKVAFT